MSDSTLRHLVLCRFTEQTSAAEVASISADFATLKHSVPGVLLFECGVNVSPEGLDQGYTHCFRLDFAGTAERDGYLVHPTHLAFVERFKPWLAQVLVLDYVAG
ncbi:Dabb family protein [Rugamonas sp. CCM 8940]|uniref:Dabb family protein n=1 Tax=Rugamonas sp. CCM 8940 TaxID=2765359 RepID=UPI0018F4CDE9|nr:Dabb family protein [Rugamonas sp. CCM 8940]MBJ7312241.1 Dabb family protein [Rugamonas sp. CCM 8940]